MSEKSMCSSGDHGPDAKVYMSRKANEPMTRFRNAMCENATNWVPWRHIAAASGLTDDSAWVSLNNLIGLKQAEFLGTCKDTCIVRNR
jgi:hypothetical protein